jgi:hypothetical protein
VAGWDGGRSGCVIMAVDCSVPPALACSIPAAPTARPSLHRGVAWPPMGASLPMPARLHARWPRAPCVLWSCAPCHPQAGHWLHTFTGPSGRPNERVSARPARETTVRVSTSMSTNSVRQHKLPYTMQHDTLQSCFDCSLCPPYLCACKQPTDRETRQQAPGRRHSDARPYISTRCRRCQRRR